MTDPPPDDPEAPIALPIDGVLDLHTFSPRDVKALVPEYLTECLARGLLQLRIIHGKGQGTLREIVHAALRRDPRVAGFRLCGEKAGAGGWGATEVSLHPRGPATAGDI